MTLAEITAILLCGGKGERLRPFTESIPKALITLNGRPLLHHLLQYLKNQGVTKSVICTGHRAEAIDAFLQENRNEGWNVVTVNSGEASMTRRIVDAWPHVQGRALICYGDTLANVSLPRLLETHQRLGGLVTQTVFPLRSDFGIVNFSEDGRVLGFQEKPILPYWVNIGFMLCEASALDLLVPEMDMVEFLASLVQRQSLRVYRHEGKHLTVNTEKDRKSAEEDVIDFYTIRDVR